MRIVHALLTVVAVLTTSFPALPASAGSDTSSDAASGLEQLADELGLPGAALRVVSERDLIEDLEYGVDGRGAAIDDRTTFVWGSVSKSVTATTVYSLDSQHRLDLEAPVDSVLPEANSFLPANVTIDDLIHHTSGLPHQVTQLDEWGRTDRALDVVPALDVAAADRGTFRYSSLNYLLLQAIAEKVTDEPFADVVARETGVHTGGRLTPGHVPFFGLPRRIDTGIDSAGMGYGYLSGSIHELSRYAQRQLTAQASNSPDTVPTGSGTAYGYGWYVETLSDGTEMRWHSGAVPGYFTHIALIPGRHLAVVFATNRYGELEANELATAARSLVLDRLGMDEPRASRFGLYESVLIAASALAILLAVCAARAALHVRSHPGRWIRTRALAALAAGSLLYFALPAVVGTPISVLGRWAPDVTLLFWLVLAELGAIAAALGARVWINAPLLQSD